MGKRKKRSGYGRKKRHFAGNQHCSVPQRVAEEHSDESSPDSSGDSEPEVSFASSVKLVDLLFADDSSEDSNGESSVGESATDCESNAADCASDCEGLSTFGGPVSEQSVDGFRLVDLECLSELILSAAVCHACGGELRLNEKSRWGLAVELSLWCVGCEAENTHFMSNKAGRCFEVNRRAVLGGRLAGIGRAGLATLCGVLNMPSPMAQKSYHRHEQCLIQAATSVAEASMVQAAKDVRAVQEQQGMERPGDLAVTSDGTWMRRGHTSLHGVTTVIAWPTGQVLDYEVLSKFCQQCATRHAQVAAGKMSQEDYLEWEHAHAADCDVTTRSSSGSMEVQGAQLEWDRSLASRGLRYLTFIGDGDSKAFSAVRDRRPYGPDVDITKEECVGHVQKRVGSRLRELKKRLGTTKLTDGKPIGGAGRLPNRTIDMLQTYFGMAIRANGGDLQAMAKACWAALLHKVALSPRQRHRFCPLGVESWCGWQREKGGAKEVYTPKDSLPEAIFEVIKPIWQQLCDKSLLERCLRGATQNRNEAWNGTLWAICPKTKFCGTQVVKLSAALACMKFNHGSVMFGRVLTAMGITPGRYTDAHLADTDDARLKYAARKGSAMAKRARKRRRRIRKGLEDEAVEAEGIPYAAGIAD